MLEYHYIKTMKSRFFIIIFSIIALGLLGLFVFTRTKQDESSENNSNHSKIVTPKTSDSQETDQEEDESLQTETFNTFINLNPTETVISTISVDFNNDTYEDEVDLVRKAGSEYVYILPGVYNPETSGYYRLDEIPTTITRANTVSVYAYDITGDHRISLIYQGIDDDDNSVMQIFIYGQENDVPEFTNIGDFSSDDTIFIQQAERSDSYELSSSAGESYSVWVYKSKKNENSDNTNTQTDQIQCEYKWNPRLEKYELAREIVVPASRLASNELSKISDGSLETYAEFLNGFWYKVSNVDKNVRYFYFDYPNKEIIQYYGNIQEIYDWGVSRVRHNGVYISCVNSSIANLHRRYDVSLVNLDEIRIYTRDDVNLIINEDNLWDGNYKKVSKQSSFDDTTLDEKQALYRTELEKGPVWNTADGSASLTFADHVYTLKTNTTTERGVYSMMVAGTSVILQLRSDSVESALHDSYVLEFGTKIETQKSKEVSVVDYDTMVFTPVNINPINCFYLDGRIYTFSREKTSE